MLFADLISVVPGLMVWTIITFGITFFVLRALRVRARSRG